MNSELFNISEIVLLCILGVSFIIQILYYLFLYGRIWRRSRQIQKNRLSFSDEYPPLSVIITARDEAESLKRNLIPILEQDYPCFEVIVVNDGKKDQSEDYLTLLEQKYPHLYHSFVPDTSRYISKKKLGTTIGIKASKYDWLVFTNAGCLPESNQWLKLMARNFTEDTDIVLGYSGYDHRKGWFQKKVAFDNLFTSMRYLGFALAHRPYMGIGKNMAYRKNIFFENKGFSSFLNLERGYDDLFINQVATKSNTRVETEKEAIVRQKPVERKKNWREEKIGYTSTGKLYKGAQRHLMGFETLTRIAFYISLTATIILTILSGHWIALSIAITAFILRYALQSCMFNLTSKVLGDKRSYYFSLPLFDLLQPLQSLKWKLSYRMRGRSDFLRKS